MKKRYYIYISACLAYILLPFAFMVDKDVSYYAYKELAYRTIIHDIVGAERDTYKISIALFDYFHNNLYTPYGATVKDVDVYADLYRGIAWCDQRAWAMGTFAGKLRIDNRMIMTKNFNGESNHTVEEILINGKWRLFDPLYGLFFIDNNELASYKDISNKPSLFLSNKNIEMLKIIDPIRYKNFTDFFIHNVYTLNKPLIWGNPVAGKDIKRRVITSILDFYVNTLGRQFSYIYQDVYLSLFSPADEADSLYFKARNYDLFNRRGLALNYYKKFIDLYTNSKNLENALFFAGIAYSKDNDVDQSLRTLQQLIHERPETIWLRMAYFYIGYDYELLKNYDSARNYYWLSLKNSKKVSPYSIRPAELKVIKRLYKILDK